LNKLISIIKINYCLKFNLYIQYIKIIFFYLKLNLGGYMSIQKAREFAQKVLASQELLDKGADLTGTSYVDLAKEIAEIAKNEGYDCTYDEILNAAIELLGPQAANSDAELSDDELESVAGGKGGMPGIPSTPPSLPSRPSKPGPINPGGPSIPPVGPIVGPPSIPGGPGRPSKPSRPGGPSMPPSGPGGPIGPGRPSKPRP
jgi:predicted ribosomally synthesized peptide with nif11-like leader